VYQYLERAKNAGAELGAAGRPRRSGAGGPAVPFSR